MESFQGNWCASKGTTSDATIFHKTDIESLANELEDMGLNRYGYHRLYSGITGEWIDAEIFMGPTYYQRLQKFTLDTQYSVAQGPSDAIKMLWQWYNYTANLANSKVRYSNCWKIYKSLILHYNYDAIVKI